MADVERHGAAHHATAATHAGEVTVVAFGVEAELVAHAVAHAVRLGGTRVVTAGLHGEQGSHAGIPATHTAAVKLRAFVRDGEALAGGADVGTATAGKALYSFLVPEGSVGEAGGHLFLDVVQGGGGRQTFSGSGLGGGNSISLVGGSGKTSTGEEGFALFGHSFEHEAVFNSGEDNVGAFLIGRIATHPVAEATVENGGAGLSHDNSGFAAGGVVGILELAFEVRTVEDHEAAGVTGAATKDHSGFGHAGVFHLGDELGHIFGVFFRLEGDKRFTLGENGLLGGRGGTLEKGVHVSIGKFLSRIGAEHDAGAFLAGSHHTLAGSKLGEPARQFFRSCEKEIAHASSRSSMVGSST